MLNLLQIKIEGSEPHSPYPPDMSMNDDEEIIRVNINIHNMSIYNIHILIYWYISNF